MATPKKSATNKNPQPAATPARSGSHNPSAGAGGDAEAGALGICLGALKPLQPDARRRIFHYLQQRYALEGGGTTDTMPESGMTGGETTERSAGLGYRGGEAARSATTG